MTLVFGALAWVPGALLAAAGLLIRHPWAVPPASVVAWVALVCFRPYRPCRWCSGRRGRRCWRCKGTKMARRPGAGTVHRVKVVLTDQWHEWRDS